MIVVFPRAEAPAARVWPGRRWLAALDALLWPAALLALLLRVDNRPGIVGAVGFAVACGYALRRLHRALAHNERYEFMSWKWGRWLTLIAGFGLTLQLALRGST